MTDGTTEDDGSGYQRYVQTPYLLQTTEIESVVEIKNLLTYDRYCGNGYLETANQHKNN